MVTNFKIQKCLDGPRRCSVMSEHFVTCSSEPVKKYVNLLLNVCFHDCLSVDNIMLYYSCTYFVSWYTRETAYWTYKNSSYYSHLLQEISGFPLLTQTCFVLCCLLMGKMKQALGATLLQRDLLTFRAIKGMENTSKGKEC